MKKILSLLSMAAVLFSVSCSKEQQVPAAKKVESITLIPATVSLTVGGTSVIQAVVSPGDAADKSLDWSSSDPAKVVVSNGTIVAVSAGMALVTATSRDGSDVSAVCVVTVTGSTPDPGNIPVQSITVPASASVAVGGTVQLNAIVLPANATDKSLTWTSLQSNVASVSPTGLVTGLAEGSATISIVAGDGSGVSASCVVTVTGSTPDPGNIPVQSITLNPTSLTLTIGASRTVIATVLPANATDKALTWSSSNSNVARVTVAGVVTAVANGTTVITVTAHDGSGKSATCAVTVGTSPGPGPAPTPHTKVPVTAPAAPAGYTKIDLSSCTIDTNNPMQYVTYGYSLADGWKEKNTAITAQQKSDRQDMYDKVSNLWDGDKATSYHTNFDINAVGSWDVRAGALRANNYIRIKLPKRYTSLCVWICNPTNGERMGYTIVDHPTDGHYHAFVEFSFSQNGTNFAFGLPYYDFASYSPKSELGSECMFRDMTCSSCAGGFSFLKIAPHMGETSSGTFGKQQGYFGIAELAIYGK